MNCIDINVSTPVAKRIVGSLQNATLNRFAFVSVCNGLVALIENSDRIDWTESGLVTDLFGVYKYFASLPDAPHVGQTSLRATSLTADNQ